MTRVNIPVTHLLNLWMGNTIIIETWSQDTGLVSDNITKIEKVKKWINIITNVVMPGEWGISVCSAKSRSDSR